MRTTDFSPLYRTIVGFDRLANMIDNAAKLEPSGGYPPYNIEQLSEHEYQIELAIAGFGEDDLEIEVQENVLTIAGKRTQSEDAEQRNYLHRGIAERSFERRFHLADHVQVREASLENGLLRIQLEREIPEAKKPRRIAVNGKSETKLISADKASAA